MIEVKELYNIITELDKQKNLDVLPPNPPLFSKLKDLYRYHILIKSIKSKDRSGKYLSAILNYIKDYSEKNFSSGLRILIDVDVNNLY